MKKIIIILFIVYFMCINILIVSASSCSKDMSRDLTKEAYYIKTNYEIIDKSIYKEVEIKEKKTVFKIPKYEFNISIYNITKNIYVVITTSAEEEKKIIHYNDTQEGTYSFTDKEFGEIYKYTIEVYSENNECANKKLKTIKFDRPMYNAYSEYAYCKNSSNYYCQKFTKTKLNIKGNEDFISKIKVNNERRSQEIKSEIKEEKKSLIDIVINNWQMYLGIFIGSVIVSLILIIVVKKRKNKKGWVE